MLRLPLRGFPVLGETQKKSYLVVGARLMSGPLQVARMRAGVVREEEENEDIFTVTKLGGMRKLLQHS
jgi:hypothetical protein